MSNAEGTPDPQDWPKAATWAFWVATALLVIVILVAGVRLAAGGWVAMADDAFLTMRSRGVFGGHPPLLSTASSAGVGVEAFNHPGALMLWLTAVPVAVLGSGAMPLAVSILNAAAVATTAVLLRRNARVVPASMVLLALAALCWSMGSGLLADIWNPHANLLPWFLAVVATWAVTQKDLPAVPIAVFVLSLVAQSHISYAAMCIPLVVVVVAVSVTRIISARRSGDQEIASRWTRWALVAVAVGVVSLLLPLIEQIGGGSDGNIARIMRGSGEQDPGVGAATALSLVLDKTVVPPFFLRGSWHPPEYLGGSLHGPALLLAAVLLAAAFAWSIWRAARRHDAALRDLAGLVAMMLFFGWVVASQLSPIYDLVRLSSTRWLWPLSALSAAVLLARPAELLGRRFGKGGQGHLAVALCAIAALGGVATLGSHNEDLSGSLPREQEVLKDLWAQAGEELSGLGSVELEGGGTGGVLYLVPGLINALDEAGVDVGLTHEGQIQQSGEWSRATGEEPWVLTLGPPDEAPTEDSELLAVHIPADPDHEAALRRRLAEIAEETSPEDLIPADSLDAAARAHFIDPVVQKWREDPLEAMENGGLLGLITTGLVDVRGQDDEEIGAIVKELQDNSSYEVALWLTPRDP